MSLKTYLLLVVATASQSVSAQQAIAHSYIKTKVFTSTDGGKAREHYDYDNGLGDITQQVDVNVSPSGKSLVTLTEYDDQRRAVKKWLPAPSTSSAFMDVESLKASARQSAENDSYPYTEYGYEQSPEGELVSEYLPGEDMRKSKGKSYRTLTNKGDVHPYKCMDYTCVDGKIYAQPATKGRYKVTEETDEEGCAILKFYNQNGQLVLSRKVVGKDEYSTYYIYDPWGNLCVIAPPSTNGGIGNGTDIETSHLLHLYAFIYKYDGSHRCIYKKMPACDPIYYVYDKAGKLIFSQDGNQRERGEWSFSIPDIFGREAIGGVCKNEIDYLAEPLGNTVVTASFANTEEFTDYIGHKIEGVELRTAKLHSAKFYDDYSFVGSLGIPTVLGYQTPGDGYGVKYDDSKGRLTGEYVASFPQGCKLMAYYYDDKGQVVEQIANDLSTTDMKFFAYDYNGRVTKLRHSLTSGDNQTTTEVYCHTYDHAGRLTKTEHQIGNAPKITLVENQYDELGRLGATTRGGKPTLATSHRYNVRSWLKSLTTPNLFTETLCYTEQTQGSTPRYDGNITSITWDADDRERGYRFTYDGLGRLTQANYYESGNRCQHYDTSYTYDTAGNITHLVRNGLQDGGSYGQIDHLHCNFDGYQLTKVIETVEDPTYNAAFNFVKGGEADIEYEYDKNGNLTKDFNKKISKIEYNLLNLPQNIVFDNGNTICYTYGQDGSKQKVVYTTKSPANKQELKYHGNMVYENNVLKQVFFDGGYVTFNGATPLYHFYLRDHLGSNRVVVSQNGEVEQVNHYYPYGGLMAESTGQQEQRYKYNGKELDRMFGLDWMDYGARQYDAALCRWFCVDPLAEKHPEANTYNYCQYNPILCMDRCGLDTIQINNMDERKWHSFNTTIDVISLNDFVYSAPNLSLTNTSYISSAIGIYSGIKEDLIHYSLKDKIDELSELSQKQQETNLLGKFGYNYYKSMKLVGKLTFGISTFCSAYDMFQYTGHNNYVFIKDAADIGFSYMSSFGPVCFGISSAYFITMALLDYNGYGVKR